MDDPLPGAQPHAAAGDRLPARRVRAGPADAAAAARDRAARPRRAPRANARHVGRACPREADSWPSARAGWAGDCRSTRGGTGARSPTSPACRASCADALPWLRIDTDRVYAVGGSMGGQETLLLLGQFPDLLAGAVAIDSVTNFNRRYADFALSPRTRGLQALARLEVGGTPRTNPVGYVLRSPTHWLRQVARSGVPLSLWWSIADLIVQDQVHQSAHFYAELRQRRPRGQRRARARHLEPFAGVRRRPAAGRAALARACCAERRRGAPSASRAPTTLVGDVAGTPPADRERADERAGSSRRGGGRPSPSAGAGASPSRRRRCVASARRRRAGRRHGPDAGRARRGRGSRACRTTRTRAVDRRARAQRRRREREAVDHEPLAASATIAASIVVRPGRGRQRAHDARDARTRPAPTQPRDVRPDDDDAQRLADVVDRATR